MKTLSFTLFVIFFSWGTCGYGKVVKYDLRIAPQTINLSGKQNVDFALTVNGGIPAPTLEFTEGDDAEITVINELNVDEEVSVHWHGILLPPIEDGVAYVNTPPIHRGQSRTFRFKLRQHGTYWYHSHTMLQEQKGVYGAFIVHPKVKKLKTDKEAVVVISDWTDENPDQVLRNLKKDGDYYLYKKNSVRSILGALNAGALGTYFQNEWIRMGGMDLSDVGYDAFLINGKRESQLAVLHPGEVIRLRIINAAASSYFHVSLGGLPMTVVSADGIDVTPIQTKELLMGMAETYDILFSVPDHKNYELKATVQDGTGSASAWVGMGEKVPAPTIPPPDLYTGMNHSSGEHAGMASHEEHGVSQNSTQESHTNHQHSKSHPKHSNIIPSTSDGVILNSITVDHLKSPTPTAFNSDKPVHEVKLILDGDMERYVWLINNQAIHEDQTITVRENEIIRFTLQNNSMMHHPMHLHGHFFRVLTNAGDYSPLKHTVDVGPHTTRIIEFFTDEPGQWMLHCHNLYHMKTGMARVVKYSTWEPSEEMKSHEDHDPHLHDHWYHYGRVLISTQEAHIHLRTSQTRNQFEFEVGAENLDPRLMGFDEGFEYETQLFYRRWISPYFSAFMGPQGVNKTFMGWIGFSYTLPLFIETNFALSHKGDVEINLEKKFQWTSWLTSEVGVNYKPQATDSKFDFEANLMFAPTWSWSAGVTYSHRKVGAGFEYQF